MNKDTDTRNASNCNRTAGRDTDQRSSEEIKRDIDRQLYEMDQTANQLQSKLSLHGLIDEVKDVFTTPGRRAPGRIMEAARDNPVPAALIGLGVVWMVADRLSGKGRHEGYEVGRGRERDWLSPGAEYFPGRSGDVDSGGGYGRGEGGGHIGRGGGRGIGERVGEMGSNIKDRAGGMMENMKDKAGGAFESVKDRISGVGHSIGNLGHSAKDKVSHVGERVSHMSTAAREKMHHYGETVSRQAVVAKDKTVDMYEETPLAFGAAALAVGVVGGLLVPSSRKEDELLGPISDKVKDRAKDLGQQAYEQGKQVATELGTKLKDEVGGEQPIGEKIRDVAHRVVDTTKQHVRESVQQLSKGQTGPGNQIGDRSGGGEFGDAGGSPTTPGLGMGTAGELKGGLGNCDLPGQTPGSFGKGTGPSRIGDENVD
ncbi:MAG TPA: hypothetical protein VD997_12665 [Phycisphaerales bacterium]|nr:hypothetical protein [Phycisphaerales bacterium]